jgi:hypothetical protein
MTADPRMRASDADRDRTASLLREHHAAGRLSPEEFNDRLDAAYQAKTLGQLDELLADLPAIDLYRLPDAGLPRYRSRVGAVGLPDALMRSGARLPSASGRFSGAWQAAWGCWFTVSLVLFVVWALSGFGYPWPAWVAGPWAAIMLGRWLSGGQPHRRGGNRELPGGGSRQ